MAAKIDELAGEHLIALHDRRKLRPDGRPSRATIDHLVVTAHRRVDRGRKTHQGTLEVRRSGGLLNPRVERLYIGGRDKTSLLDGLAGQHDMDRLSSLTEPVSRTTVGGRGREAAERDHPPHRSPTCLRSP